MTLWLKFGATRRRKCPKLADRRKVRLGVITIILRRLSSFVSSEQCLLDLPRVVKIHTRAWILFWCRM